MSKDFSLFQEKLKPLSIVLFLQRKFRYVRFVIPSKGTTSLQAVHCLSLVLVTLWLLGQ